MRGMKLTLVLGVLALAGCQELDTENLNAPDRERALASANDVESLLRGGYATFYDQLADNSYPNWALSVGADEMTSSWGNNGMQQFGSEPRVAYPNDLVFGYRGLTQTPWTVMYRIVSNMNDGLKAIADGLEFGDDGEDTPRAEAMARFASGLAHGWVALQYDQGFIYRETDDLETTDFEFVDYKELMDYAMQQLDLAKDIAQKNSFSMDGTWIFGRETSSADLVRIISSYQARYLASLARNPEERAAVNWQKVIDLANAGVTEDWGPILGGTDTWDTDDKGYQGKLDWFRIDYKTIGPGDISGAYKTWLDTPPSGRQPFDIDSPDRRIMGSGGVGTTGKFMRYRFAQNFREDRGTYHFSRYYLSRWPTLQPSHTNQTGLDPIFPVAELDLLKAEAYIRQSKPDLAVPLINKTRVAVGELPPVTVNGVPQSADCVPRWDGVNCGTLMEALMYEKRLQNIANAAGVAYFDARGWGILVSGTQLHFPVPASELEILGLPYYRFGGVGDPWAAK